MGGSGEGSDTNDSAESSASAEGIDSGDDSSAYGGGDAGEGIDSGAESTNQTDSGESGDGGDDSSAYGSIEVSVDAPNEVDTGTPGEVAVESPEVIKSETPDEISFDGDGDEESAYGQDVSEQEEDGKDGQNPEVLVEQDIQKDENESKSENETEAEKLSEEELGILQEQADKVAQEYNDKYSPYERAVSKGLEGVTETPNGGVSFEKSEAIYVTEDGEKAIVTIEATGNRSSDAAAANRAIGIDGEPDGYTWHHLDNYNVKDNTITLELVERSAHKSTTPHSGGCAQYDAVHGSSYNPPKSSNR